MANKIPVIILSGFLGSGKTTLLARLLDHCAPKQWRPAVIMNEVGDINLDGQMVDEAIAMREMLSGCICCTIRGDLGMELRDLIAETSPNLILIEATGVANPMEIFDAVTDAALLEPIDIRTMITVVDAAHFLHWHRKGAGRTYRLMRDQIRCASMLLINKADQISDAELEEAKRLMAEINPQAFVQATVQCEINEKTLDRVLHENERFSLDDAKRQGRHEDAVSHHKHEHGQSCEDHDHREHHEHHDHHEHAGHHHSYDHVMVYTHYFDRPLAGSRFEQLIGRLPDHVYRAKGIYTEAETGERMMFQYAYRQLNTFRIDPQGSVQDVAVFMGEQFLKQELKRELEAVY